MKIDIARVLINNLIDRVVVDEGGRKSISGVLTDSELEALKLACSIFTENKPASDHDSNIFVKTEGSKIFDSDVEVKLNFDSLDFPEPPKDVRVCLDFGTAMSKATLVRDNIENDEEEIIILKLGIPGDQEEVSEVMLISSVFIDNAGNLWFGKAAVDHSMIEKQNSVRQRLDNIKRWLSEEVQDEPVDRRFNPTDEVITYEDIVLAYLMFMTWNMNSCLIKLDYPSNLPRRFAMPCLTGEKKREVQYRLKQFVGEAQILADTFGNAITEGLSVSRFMTAVRDLRGSIRNYPYVAEAITEPLGVAGSIMSWKNEVNSLLMVVDIGAGTSDLSLYRLGYNSEVDKHIAYEVKDTSRVLTQAGNYLDRILIEQIIKKSGITSDDKMWVNVRSALELEIRVHKETLFNEESVLISLMNGDAVEIDLKEFLELEAVQQFGEELRSIMRNILGSIDHSWIKWIGAHPARKLVVALTGGGSELPMVQSLANEPIHINGVEIPVERSQKFPEWLRELDENLASDYPRVAVSLGGARKRLINDEGSATITGW